MCFLLFEFRPPRAAFTGPRPKPTSAGRLQPEGFLARSRQAENWGKPSGGTNFLLACHGGGFSVPVKKAGGGAVTRSEGRKWREWRTGPAALPENGGRLPVR